MTVKEREAELAPMLASDVEQWLEEHPDDALCIALDGFERIQSTTLAEDIQRFLADWCGLLTDPDATFAGRFGCVFLGRNKNRWDELYDKEWHGRISEHRVGGLGEEDARKFLESAAVHHETLKDSITARNLRQHADAILAAACEQRSGEEPSSFHPYYLDLAYGILYDQGVQFQPADLGQTPAELQDRFLRYFEIGQREVFEAFRCLALAGSFDEELFEHLVEQRCIANGLHFPVITGEDYSYVEEIRDMPGTFRFHRLMERALIKNQSAKAEDLAVARKRIDVILDYLKEKAVFSKLADCTSYQKGMTIAFDRQHDDLFDLPSLDAFFLALEAPFDFKAFVNVRIPWWRKLADLWKRYQPEGERSRQTSSGVAEMLMAQGRYAEAENLQLEILEANERLLGKDHPDTLNGVNNLALFVQAKGDFAGAEPLFRRALEGCERVLGVDHPDTIRSVHNLASLLQEKGDLAGAELLYERALTIWDKAEGPEYRNVAGGLASLNNLAELYSAQGQYAEAEVLYERMLSIWEMKLGREHPNVALSLNNLAALYQTQGLYAEAEPLYERSLAISEKALGPEHPDVAMSLNNLAALYSTQGQYAKAEPLSRRALAIWEKALGPDHAKVAKSLNVLAELYNRQGEPGKAMPLLKRALRVSEKALGPDHPDVAMSLNNLAGFYCTQAQYAKAEPLLRRALAIWEKALGPDYPDVASSLNNLAELYSTRGQYAKAEPLLRRALAIWEKALGPDHPGVATSLNNLAGFYDTQGQYAKAEPLRASRNILSSDWVEKRLTYY